MVRAAIVWNIAASIKALGTDVRLAWRRLAAMVHPKN